MKRLLIETFPLKVEFNQIRESMTKNAGRAIIRNMKIQQADKPNKNQRIYSRSILERETRQLIENCRKVGARGIIGELDHPDCHCYGTEILTKDGWEKLDLVQVGKEIPTLNTATGDIEVQPIQRVINEPYTGKMISIKGKNIDCLVTPNHRFFLVDRHGKYIEHTAQEIIKLKETKKVTHLIIPTVAENWNGIKYENWTLPPYEITSKNVKYEFVQKQTHPLVLNAKSFFSFLGFYLAEGHVDDRKKRDGFRISISQNRGIKADKFKMILETLSPELKWNIQERKNGKGIIFNCSDARLWSYLEPLGNKYTKFIPDDIKNASTDLLQELLDWYLLGDGSVTNSNNYSRKSIFSVSKQLMEDFNEILLKLGICGIIKEQIPKDRKIEGRLIEAKNSKPIYRLWLKESKGIHVDFRFLQVEEVEYNGTVHCVTVANGTFYARNNGYPFWSGNSSVVNLKNACLGVLDYRWKGNDMLGDVEILNTPNGKILREIYEAGYVPGISSRGMGSVSELTEDDGVVEVEDDFNLLCWDAVSDPSSHNAYFKEIREGKQLKESVSKYPQKKIDNLMQTIICSLSGNCCIK